MDTLSAGEKAVYGLEVFLAGRGPDYGAEAWTAPIFVRIFP